MPRARSRSSVDRLAGLLVGLGDEVLGPFAVGHPPAGEPEDERHRDEPLLGAVVEVALQAAALGVGGGDDAGARALEVLHAGGELGVGAGAEQGARHGGVHRGQRADRRQRHERGEGAQRHARQRLGEGVDGQRAQVGPVGEHRVVRGREEQPERERDRRDRDDEAQDPHREREEQVDEVLPRRRVGDPLAQPPEGGGGAQRPVRIGEVEPEQEVEQSPLAPRQGAPGEQHADEDGDADQGHGGARARRQADDEEDEVGEPEREGEQLVGELPGGPAVQQVSHHVA